MITTRTHKHLTWIDIENPGPHDIAAIIRDFTIHPAWADELMHPSERAKTDSNDHGFYAALHYPDHPSQLNEPQDAEIDYIIGEHFLITAHYAPIDLMLEFAKQFETDHVLDRLHIATGADLFLAINNHLYRDLREELEPFRKNIRQIESEIFNGREFHMVREISHLHRRLLDFKQAMRSHQIILHSLELRGPKLFPGALLSQDTMFREYSRVESALENCLELLRELRETNDSLLSAKTNDVTKKLTLMAFITFPLTLVATVLEYRGAPQMFQGTHGFWVIVGILVGLFVLMQGYFSYKKWI